MNENEQIFIKGREVASKKYVDDIVAAAVNRGEPVTYVEEEYSEYKSCVLEEHNRGVYVFKNGP